jgi:aldehyde dehydrogenase
MTVYAAPGDPASPARYATRYDNFIGGEWVPPVKGQYFENPTPVTGRTGPVRTGSTPTSPSMACPGAAAASP